MTSFRCKSDKKFQQHFIETTFLMLQSSLPISLIRFIHSSKHMLVLSIMLHMSSFATTSSYATTTSSSVLLLRNEVRQLYEKMSSNGQRFSSNHSKFILVNVTSKAHHVSYMDFSLGKLIDIHSREEKLQYIQGLVLNILYQRRKYKNVWV